MNRRTLIPVIAVVLMLVAFWLWKHQPNERQTASRPLPVKPVTVTPLSEVMATRLTKPRVSEPVQPVAIAPPVNAADLYREAFKQLAALSEAEKELLADWKRDADSSELCAKLKPIVALADEAAAITNCDWGIKNIGWGTQLPHLAPARQLARALIWNAAHCRGDDSAGIGDDLAAALHVGQSVGSEFLIEHLVNIAIERIAINYLTVNIGKLPVKELERLAESLGNYQRDEALHRDLQSEVDTWNQQAKQYATMSLEDIQNDLQGIPSDLGDKKVVPMDKSQAIGWIQQKAELISEYMEIAELPDSQYQTAQRAWLAKVQEAQQANPFLEDLWSVIQMVTDKTQTIEVQQAMVIAGLKVIEYGQDALLQYHDPANGQAFLYRETPAGFELQSAYAPNGKPVVLTFQNGE